jgi:predicted nucleic acid-binding protein
LILIDSNAWIYFLDAALPEHARAKKRLAALLADEDALMPAIVQMEVIHYIVARLGEGAGDVIDTFLSFPGDVEPLSGATVGEAARLLLAHRGTGIGGRDAALLVTAQRREASLVTADKALAAVARKLGVKVASPISP